MSFDTYFNELDLIHYVKEKPKCCDNTDNYIFNEGISSCKICGEIISNIIDSPEWRYYGNIGKNNNQVRCGMPVNMLLPKSSMGTAISSKNRNENMNKVNMYQRWNSMPYKERSLYKVFNEIDTKCKQNNLPNIISTTAKSLYKIVSDIKISRGSNRRGIIAASVFYACKECNVPRSTNELSYIFDIDIKVMTKGCKNFTNILRLSSGNKKRVQSHKSINLHDFIERFSHRLNLNSTNIEHILKISRLSQELGLINDNTPPAMASGCIFLYIKYYKLDVNKKEVSKVCKISEVTINKCYKKLESVPEIINYLKNIL